MDARGGVVRPDRDGAGRRRAVRRGGGLRREIVGRGHNQVTTLLDPTAHAEVMAIREACQSLGRFDLKGCELYTSCEPCPMCLAAIYWARLDRVFYACTRHDAAEIGFDDDFIYEQLPLEIAARSLPDGTDRAGAFARPVPRVDREAG